MTRTRCQICGRRKHVRKDGAIVSHFTRGDRCPGGGFPPIEVGDGRLVQLVADLKAAEAAARAEIKALEDRRANWIDPALTRRASSLFLRRFKLERRLDRHKAWPARYERSRARQMAEHGYTWAEPPPEYLTRRA